MAKKPRRRVVLLTGMHRSGTSLLAQMLRRTGLHFGGPLLNDPRIDAPLGYGEHAEVVALHENLLNGMGRAWHTPDGVLPLPPGWEFWPETMSVREALGTIIDRELTAGGVWYVKDPRLSRLLPLWFDLLKDRGIAAEIVLCMRHPSAVAASLAQRNGMPQAQALDAWQAHVADVLAALEGRPCHMVVYDELCATPHIALARLLTALRVDADPADIDAACALAAQSHRHHRAVPFGEGATNRQREAQQLYDNVVSGQAGTAGLAGAKRPASPASVAVIMRTRDRSVFLPRALRSVLAQTHAVWHLYIVNDGGAPAPVDAAIAPYRLALGARLSLFHLPGCIGMEAASNHAIAAASEDFIVIHDDDDTWQPRFLETCLASMAATGLRGVVTACTRIDECSAAHGVITTGTTRFLPDMTGIHYHELLAVNCFPPISFVYDRKVIAEIGAYRSDLPVLGDWDFNLRFAARYSIGFVNEPLANWHRRPPDDAFPNSSESEHKRVAHLLHDARLRDAGAGAAAIVGAILPVVRTATAEAIALQALSPHQTALDGIGAGIAALLDRANSSARILTPVRWESIERKDDCCISLSDDPQIHFQPLHPPLQPGRWRFSVELSVPPGHSHVQLYFGEHEPFIESQSIVLQREGPNHFGGVVTTAAPIRHIRFDPMARPGRFQLGPIAVTGAGRRFPDFLCIGAQRSGTTWLHRNLAARHDVWLPPSKEVHFFDTVFGPDGPRWARDRLRFLSQCQNDVLQGASVVAANDPAWRQLEWAARFATSRTIDPDWYAGLFQEAPPGAVCGEISPGYAVLPEEGVAYAAQLMPGMKVLFLMRDPIERTLSGAMHEVTTAAGNLAPPSSAALAAALADPRCVTRSAYRETIERWERHVGPDRMNYLFFDEIRASPQTALRQVCDAIGVPYSDSAFPLAAQPQNENPVCVDTVATAEDRIMLANRCMDDLEWLSERFGGPAKAWLSRGQRLASRSTQVFQPGEPTRANIAQAMQQVVETHGPWASHNIELADDLFTMGEAPTGDGLRLRRFLTITEALLGKTTRQTRVLDLACGEGLYALEYARRGGQVVAVEIRNANLARARLAQWALQLPNLEIVQDDVRNVSSARYGQFDIVICSGILYHLDTPDVFEFVEAIAAMTTRLAIFDTRIAVQGEQQRKWRGRDYDGVIYREHAEAASAAERDSAIWSSHLNNESFWLTQESLLRVLEQSGFTTVMQLHRPAQLKAKTDRVTLIALKGETPTPIITPV